jgi:hypothetical protein
MAYFQLEHAKALYLRFAAIYSNRFVLPYHDEDFKSVWYGEWASALANVHVSLIKSVLDHCRLNLEWPPTTAQFLSLCEKMSGFPSLDEALQLIIRKDINHPLIAAISVKMDSWSLKNDKIEVLRKKFKIVYDNALADYRRSPESAQKLFISLQPKEISPIAISSPSTVAPAIINHPNWPKEKLNRHSPHFDLDLYSERRKYLLSLCDYSASTLSHDDMYDRIRFKREIIALERLSKSTLSKGIT